MRHPPYYKPWASRPLRVPRVNGICYTPMASESQGWHRQFGVIPVTSARMPRTPATMCSILLRIACVLGVGKKTPCKDRCVTLRTAVAKGTGIANSSGSSLKHLRRVRREPRQAPSRLRQLKHLERVQFPQSLHQVRPHRPRHLLRLPNFLRDTRQFSYDTFPHSSLNVWWQ